MGSREVTISARDVEEMTIDLNGAPIVSPVVGLWNIYEFALFLALVALPAVTSVSLGESQVSAHRPSAKQRVRRMLALPMRAFVAGATAAAAGALCGAVVVLTRQAVTDWITAAIAVVTLSVLWRFKINEPYVVVASGALGLLLH